MSYGAVSTLCNIPKTTLKDRVNCTCSDTPGRPTVLNSEEEVIIIEIVDLLADWGFPFIEEDLRQFVKSYLDKKGVATRFVDNPLTIRFVNIFLSRHPGFILRKTNAIKRTRTSLSQEEVQKFFDNFQKSAEGVTPRNMYNFDEMNLRATPGARGAFKRGGLSIVRKFRMPPNRQCP
jgi:hypothetical protein